MAGITFSVLRVTHKLWARISLQAATGWGSWGLSPSQTRWHPDGAEFPGEDHSFKKPRNTTGPTATVLCFLPLLFPCRDNQEDGMGQTDTSPVAELAEKPPVGAHWTTVKEVGCQNLRSVVFTAMTVSSLKKDAAIDSCRQHWAPHVRFHM